VKIRRVEIHFFWKKMIARDAFLAWLERDGAQFPHILVKPTHGKGLGVYWDAPVLGDADIPLQAEATIATLPARLIVNAASFGNFMDAHDTVKCAFRRLMDVASVSKQCPVKDDERLRIVLWLVLMNAEFAQNESDVSNDWLHYIRALPTRFDTPVFWNDVERAWLAGTPLMSALDAKASKLEREWRFLHEHFFARLNLDISLEDWKWADAAFWSRVLSFKSCAAADDGADLHMMPLIDFCNHSVDPSVRWEPLQDGGVALKAFSWTVLSPGLELCISYGDKSNSELLFVHGCISLGL
jgi:hypothetical protein